MPSKRLLSFGTASLTNTVSLNIAIDTARFNCLSLSGNHRGGVPARPPKNLEDMLSQSPFLSPKDIPRVASFIRACCKLDPSQRPSADDLTVHAWLMDAYTPGDEWDGPY